jgi:hypothetical protein
MKLKMVIYRREDDFSFFEIQSSEGQKARPDPRALDKYL